MFAHALTLRVVQACCWRVLTSLLEGHSAQTGRDGVFMLKYMCMLLERGIRRRALGECFVKGARLHVEPVEAHNLVLRWCGINRFCVHLAPLVC